MYHFAENFLFSETPLKGFPATTPWSWAYRDPYFFEQTDSRNGVA